MATRTQPGRKITLEEPEPLQVVPSHDTFSPHKLAATSLAEQYRHQRISDNWEPRGFERWQYQRALLHNMNLLGGINGDQELPGLQRYEPVSTCNETMDCHCTGPYGE